ncbi:MAG: hypothetical protein ACE5R6_18460 [Candidatus Heimdallarchaeota archaeon]
MGFTDVFLIEATKTLDKKVPQFIRKMRRMLLDAFRCALRLSIFDEELKTGHQALKTDRTSSVICSSNTPFESHFE